ncbi:hypothetical protein ARMGADRAFT_87477 [Armillaria gallica]|uniref:Uncharacterized protein n=1 Tax=Armillaria gallica TaxID=47427 RepID=A0A2H3CXX9_ARMGA|nr:hypothetical protein ARMGADRAFT_87477 [Armillaria gallica]
MDVCGGSRPTDDMTTTYTLPIRLLVYWSQLAVDDATWFSGVGTWFITRLKYERSARVRSQHAGRRGGSVHGEGTVRRTCARMYGKGTVCGEGHGWVRAIISLDGRGRSDVEGPVAVREVVGGGETGSHKGREGPVAVECGRSI